MCNSIARASSSKTKPKARPSCACQLLRIRASVIEGGSRLTCCSTSRLFGKACFLLEDHQRAELAYGKVLGDSTYSAAAWKGLREVHAATGNGGKLITALQELVSRMLNMCSMLSKILESECHVIDMHGISTNKS